MARKLRELIDEARIHINDTEEPFRNSDSELLTYLNDALFEVRRLRPDAFISTAFLVPQYTIGSIGEDFPLDGQFFTPVAYFIAGSAELKDDEHVNESRATGLLALFAAKLTKAGA